MMYSQEFLPHFLQFLGVTDWQNAAGITSGPLKIGHRFLQFGCSNHWSNLGIWDDEWSCWMTGCDLAKCCRSVSLQRLCNGVLVDNVVLGRPRCRDMPFPTHLRVVCLDSVLRGASSRGFTYSYATFPRRRPRQDLHRSRLVYGFLLQSLQVTAYRCLSTVFCGFCIHTINQTDRVIPHTIVLRLAELDILDLFSFPVFHCAEDIACVQTYA